MYNHVLPHVQPRTTHPPSCIRGGSRAPSPPENKKIIKLAVFKLNSSKPTYKLMYHPTSITQKFPPTRHPGADLGGVLPLCRKYLLEPYAIRFQTPNTTCIVMYNHCPTLCNAPSHFPEHITSYYPPLIPSQVAKPISIAAQGIPMIFPIK